jgi:hypothetical protein
MDWSSLTSTLKPLTDKVSPIVEKASPYLDRAKTAGYKALDFTQKQLQNTPLILKTHDELIELRTKKRVILITYDETHTDAREILLRSPVWSAKAWSDAAELRFVEMKVWSEIATELGVTSSVDMRVWYIWEETYHGMSIESILSWWETRCYDGKSPEGADAESPKPENNQTKPSRVVDPLAEK